MLRVKAICKKQGITLKELAEKMEVSPETVTRILGKEGNPTLTSLKNISNALGVPLNQIFDDFNDEMKVRGYIEVDDTIHRITNFNDLHQLYTELRTKE